MYFIEQHFLLTILAKMIKVSFLFTYLFTKKKITFPGLRFMILMLTVQNVFSITWHLHFEMILSKADFCLTKYYVLSIQNLIKVSRSIFNKKIFSSHR